MSATFKNSKRNVNQAELRKFMREHKDKTKKVLQKIESPLAKYNELGQLTCILCKSIVRSEAIWNVHINAKQHRENIEKAKKLKESTNNFTQTIKRTHSPPHDIQHKKLKGILKNTTSTTQELSDSKIEESIVPETNFQKQLAVTNVQGIQESSKDVPNNMTVDNILPEVLLPEGFFDDPKLDAKARNIEYKNPIEEEWERFQKEIRDANTESAVIIAEDQDEATAERQLEDVEEQMKNWSRVLDLDKKKMEIIAHMKEDNSPDEDEPMSADEDQFDEFLDWRSKKAYK